MPVSSYEQSLLESYLITRLAIPSLVLLHAMYDSGVDAYIVHYASGIGPSVVMVRMSDVCAHAAQHTLPAPSRSSTPVQTSPTPAATSQGVQTYNYAYLLGGALTSDATLTLPPVGVMPECDCGATKCGQPRHSTWCTLYSA